MKDINFIIILFFLYIILIITAASLGDLVDINNQLGELFNRESNINLTSGNLSFDDTLKYSTKLVEENFNYHHRIWSDDSENVSDIILNGGDCTEYAYLYGAIFEENGHYSQTISLFTEESPIGHAFAIVWDSNISQYCILDQQSSACFEMGEGNYEIFQEEEKDLSEGPIWNLSALDLSYYVLEGNCTKESCPGHWENMIINDLTLQRKD